MKQPGGLLVILSLVLGLIAVTSCTPAPTPPTLTPLPTTEPVQPAPVPTPTPGDNPPQITGYYIQPKINAGLEFPVTANVTDEEIERVYVIFRNGEKLETTMEKVDGEYRASLKLPSKGEYWAGLHPYEWTDRVRRVWRGWFLFC